MNKKLIVAIVVVILLALAMLLVVYGQNLYQMFLRAHGMG
jgi:hypothetical protein